jgi:tRNA1(Val) A37 N6-methylase TrmN6
MSDTMKIADIKAGKRYRRDFGDLDALAARIAGGLLQPIAVTPDGILVVGARRLEAAKKLGWETIAVHVVTELDDALALLKAERDENTCRKDFTITEKVALGQALEDLERRQAKQRQRDGGRNGGKGSGNLPEPSTGDTRDKVAGAVGMSGRSYQKARTVVEAAESDPRRFGDVAAKMDQTGNIDQAFKNVQRRRREDERRDQASRIEGTCGIITGDFRDLGPTLPDNSVDLIFCDPPYDADSVPLYGDLARFAARVLVPGGSLLVYCGHHALLRVGALMEPHLSWWWCCACVHAQVGKGFFGRQVAVGWKPILWWTKGPLAPFTDLVPDTVSGGRHKGEHDWQQAVSEAEHFIRRLCPPGGVVLDPCCGSGTTLIAASRLGRKFIGIERDPDTAARARARVVEEGRQERDTA